VPRASQSKLANPIAENAAENRPKRPFNNGKKRITGPKPDSVRDTRARRAETSRNRTVPATGTPHALKDKVLSVATTEARCDAIENRRVAEPPAPPAKPASQGSPNRKIGQNRGGQLSKVERSRGGRRSTALRLSEVRNIIAAGEFTAEEHRPLNRHTTIHFEAAQIADPVRAIGQYLKLAGDWLRTQGAVFAYIWVREAGEKKGEHVHILMHVRPDLVSAFARRERGWRTRIGAARALGAFRSSAVGRSYRHAVTGIQFGERYSDHLRQVIGYLLKGAERRAVDALGLRRVEPGGELWGKRSGMSENIGHAARLRSGSIK